MMSASIDSPEISSPSERQVPYIAGDKPLANVEIRRPIIAGGVVIVKMAIIGVGCADTCRRRLIVHVFGVGVNRNERKISRAMFQLQIAGVVVGPSSPTAVQGCVAAKVDDMDAVCYRAIAGGWVRVAESRIRSAGMAD